ncbi:MAG: glycoside hydrolase family 127 protein, partial [Clostridia bacterium]|nr:glycoside hydrolase family 127 protein [Clostridia bacterium]
MKNLYFANTEIKDGFWKYYTDLVRNVTVHAVYDRFKETGRFDAFKCEWREGDNPDLKPHIYWDSDVAKWIEGVAYLTEVKPEPELEALVDLTVDFIEKNQRADGYFNSYFLTVEPSKIFTDRSAHELYCTGHLIEAAIAYHKATGKDKLLKCMLKNVDCIYRIFVEEGSARFTTPGHEEIEIALIKLYDYTGDKKHLDLARFFIDKRGTCENDDLKWNGDGWFDYFQSEMPVREMSEAKGHAVRAGYLYTAMAMLSKRDGDKALKEACDRLFSNIVNTKMSITGGVGAQKHGEIYSYSYNLPNRDVYNETCAAISLAMFAGALQEIEQSSVYGDIIERIYYNGFLSGISLGGDEFFYTNPLELDIKKYQHKGAYQPISQRVKVFSCSCCPPNVVRMLASLPRYMYTLDGDTVYCNQFADSETKLLIGGKDANLTQKTNYPFDGHIEFTYHGEPVTLKVRIPDWCAEYKGETVNGFTSFSLTNGET